MSIPMKSLPAIFQETLHLAIPSNTSPSTHHCNSTHTSITDATIENLWQTLSNHYQQPHRHYHTFKHLQAMFQYLGLYKNQLKDPIAVALAIFYHDIIYDTTLTKVQISNEKQSAEFFAQSLSAYINKNLTKRVIQLILMTEGHQLSNDKDEDGKLFLDMDLSILGQSPEIYHSYAKAIRLEYIHIDDYDYRQGRKEVLQRFLQRPRLYFSEVFYQQYESLARDNLQNELNRLS